MKSFVIIGSKLHHNNNSLPKTSYKHKKASFKEAFLIMKRAGGNKMTLKCNFMTTDKELLDCEKRQHHKANLENK